MTPLRFARVAPAWIVLSRLIVGTAFLWSGVAKVRYPHAFLSDVYAYEIVGSKAGLLVAMVLPWLEIALGACLLGGVLLGGAFLASAVLTAVFAAAQASALIRGLTISCGCFSPTDPAKVVSYGTLARTILLFTLAASATVAALKRVSPPAEPDALPHSPAPAPAA